MKKRLANPTKVNMRDRLHGFQADQNRAKVSSLILPDRLIPGIAKTGDAIEVAVDSRFDVNFGRLGYRAVHLKPVSERFDLIFAPGLKPYCSAISAGITRRPCSSTSTHKVGLIP